MNATDLTALLRSDLTDAVNRAVLRDALADLGHDADIDGAYAGGCEDAEEQCNDSGVSDTPDGGWDSWLLCGVTAHDVAERFGLASRDDLREMDDDARRDLFDGPAWKAVLVAYHAGATESAEDWQRFQDGLEA